MNQINTILLTALVLGLSVGAYFLYMENKKKKVTVTPPVVTPTPPIVITPPPVVPVQPPTIPVTVRPPRTPTVPLAVTESFSNNRFIGVL